MLSSVPAFRLELFAGSCRQSLWSLVNACAITFCVNTFDVSFARDCYIREPAEPALLALLGRNTADCLPSTPDLDLPSMPTFGPCDLFGSKVLFAGGPDELADDEEAPVGPDDEALLAAA